MNTTFFREASDLGGSGGGMSEIEKGNRIIGEFMGSYFRDPLNYMFDKSWDKLMPVIKKIDNILKEAKKDGGIKAWTLIKQRHAPVFNELQNLDLENTWYCVVKFLQWYNTSQHKK